MPVEYRDGSRSAHPFPLRALPLKGQLPACSLELRFALLSIRHTEMDAVVDGAWLRNAEVSRPRPAGQTDDLVYDITRSQLAELCRGEAHVRLYLYQTGLETAVVGFYKALVDHLLSHPGSVSVQPMYYEAPRAPRRGHSTPSRAHGAVGVTRSGRRGKQPVPEGDAMDDVTGRGAQARLLSRTCGRSRARTASARSSTWKRSSPGWRAPAGRARRSGRSRRAAEGAAEKATYNENWARNLVERGGSRSDRCKEHRQKHRINIQGMAVAYIDLQTVGEVADRENPAGPLGGLGPLPAAHEVVPDTSYDLQDVRVGMTDEHVTR